MPNTPSAKKRVRQNAKRRALNTWRKKRIKTQVKTFLRAVQEQDVKTAEDVFRKTCGLLDTAARRKSRLSRRLVELKARSS